MLVHFANKTRWQQSFSSKYYIFRYNNEKFSLINYSQSGWVRVHVSICIFAFMDFPALNDRYSLASLARLTFKVIVETVLEQIGARDAYPHRRWPKRLLWNIILFRFLFPDFERLFAKSRVFLTLGNFQSLFNIVHRVCENDLKGLNRENVHMKRTKNKLKFY